MKQKNSTCLEEAKLLITAGKAQPQPAETQTDIEKAIAQLPCMQILRGAVYSPPLEGLGEVWLDSQDVMQALHISPRTLQTLRTNGTLPYSRIGNKIYYRKQDILKILTDNYIMFKIKGNEHK